MLRFYLLIAIRLKIFFFFFLRNGISLRPLNLLFFPFLLQNSAWSSLVAFNENRRYKKKIQNTPLPTNPVFIIGHWRTGSTFLHQIFQCDPQFTTPTLMQCTYPESFISARRSITLAMNFFLTEKRPMDNVRLGIHDPQEDEYVVFRMTGISPMEKLIFPHTSQYFLLDTQQFSLSDSQRIKWENAFTCFTKKLYMHTGKRIVFKNPFHSFRIHTLQEIFPDALFIHIYRDPRIVIPSTKHMWTIVGNHNSMRKEWKPPEFEEIITGFDTLMNRVYNDLSALPANNYIELSFEELEQEPIPAVKSLYSHFGFEYTTTFEDRLNDLLKRLSSYEKNRYDLSKAQEELICSRLVHHMKRGRYG